jgi:hypothetical protein
VCVAVVGSAKGESKRKEVLLGLILQEVKHKKMNGLLPSLELK